MKRASGSRSVAANSNLGIIVTGDNAKIVAAQQKPSPEHPERIIYGDIPRRPPAFQQRDTLRNLLLDAGQLAIISTLTGARGIGKSQLAAAYARECIDDGWPLVAWIAAERPGQILSDLDQLSRAMGLHEENDDSQSAATKVRRWLEIAGGKRCLIVFDNASDPDSLIGWLPSTGSARIVVTSNRRSFESLGTLIDVEAFTPDEARTYLFERTGLHDEAGANVLSEEVGRLPLALAQASALIKAQHLSYSEFLDRLRKTPLDKYLTRLPGDAYPQGAAETVLLALKHAGRRSRLRRALLLLLSILSPDGVAREFLYSAPIGGRVMEWPFTSRKASRVKVDEALEHLVEASLVTLSFDGQTVTMHRFTQRVTREYTGSVKDYGLVRASQFISEQLNQGEFNREERTTKEHLIVQVASIWHNFATGSPARIGYFGRRTRRQLVKKLIHLPIWSVGELGRSVNVARAIELGTSVTRECEAWLGPSHPDTLKSRNYLGIAYLNAGRIDEAVDLHRRNLAARERILGRDHPHTLDSRNELAVAYHKAGRIDEAIDLDQGTLAARERILGPDHPATMASRNNLAAAYLDAGRAEEAIDLHRRNIADLERVLGPDDSSVSITRSNLARAYQKAGRIDEAIDLERQSVADLERILGPDHPDTLISRSGLATAYGDAGQIDEAIDVHRQTLAARERILGPDHPDTLASRRYLYNANKKREECGPGGSAPRPGRDADDSDGRL